VVPLQVHRLRYTPAVVCGPSSQASIPFALNYNGGPDLYCTAACVLLSVLLSVLPVACSCLVAADGVVLSPDLQPVPPGFVMSPCGQQLLRPNGKPVPRGVHVGPGFRLLKPTGELMPDGKPHP
jgi:hypothetical protein